MLPVLAALALSGQTPAPFTARDSVEMVRIADYSLSAGTRQIVPAPDGQHVAVVVYRGNLETGLNDYRLLLFTAEELRAALGEEGALAAGTVLAEAGTDRRWPESAAIDGLSWTDAGRLTFVRRGADRRAELYEVALGGAGPRRLFAMPDGVDNIQTYDRSRDGALAVFSASVARPREDLSQRGFVLDPATGGAGAISGGTPPPRDLVYFLADTRSGEVRRLPFTTAGWPARAAFSPSGRWALVRVKAIPTQRELQYAEIGRVYARASPPGAPPPELATVFAPLLYTRFMLIDTADGSARPLFDAPGFAVGQFGQAALSQPVWVEHEEAVIVGPTYLPLTGTAAEIARRRAGQSIALVRLADGRAERLLAVPETVQYGAAYPRMTHLENAGTDAVGVRFSGFGEPEVRRRLAVRGGRWREEAAGPPQPTSSASATLELRVGQGFNRPPELEVLDPATGRSAPLLRLNPQLDGRPLGNAREVSWTDPDGTRRTALLLEPDGPRPAAPRAAIIQVHAYDPDEFVVDGGSSTTGGYGARALVGRGMVVLQLPFRPLAAAGGGEQARELDQFDRALSGAVAMLVEREGVDPARIGLTGFSREGMRVEHAITFASHRFAAALVADSTAATPDAYALAYPLMQEWEQSWYIGAPFWGEGRALWYARSPLFNLDRICTPLRIETFGDGLSPQWSIYAILRRMGRPVEFFHIPYAGHLLTSPASRFAEQEALVDWFDFWLNGREAADPAKQEQNRRWRALRAQQQGSESACSAGDATVVPLAVP